jgi:hypothetical protein
MAVNSISYPQNSFPQYSFPLLSFPSYVTSSPVYTRDHRAPARYTCPLANSMVCGTLGICMKNCNFEKYPGNIYDLFIKK